MELESIEGVEETYTEEEFNMLLEEGEIDLSVIDDFQIEQTSNSENITKEEENTVIQQLSSKSSNAGTVTILTPGLGSTSGYWGYVEGRFPKALESKLNANIYEHYLKTTSNLPATQASTLEIDYALREDIKNNKNVVVLVNFTSVSDTVEPKVSELKKLIQLICIINPNTKFNLIGHSQGGIVNLGVTNDYISKVENLISIGTPYHPNMLVGLATASRHGCNLASKVSSSIRNACDDFIDEYIVDNYNAYNELRKLNGPVREIISEWNDKSYSTRKQVDYTAIATTAGLSYTHVLKVPSGIKCSGWFKCWTTYSYIRVKVGFSLNTDGLVATKSALGEGMYVGSEYIHDSTASRYFPNVQTTRKVVVNFIPFVDIHDGAKNGVYSGWIPHDVQGQNSKIKDQILKRM